jgi:hypothetical protein
LIEFTIPAEFTLHLAGLSANSVDLSTKSASTPQLGIFLFTV